MEQRRPVLEQKVKVDETVNSYNGFFWACFGEIQGKSVAN